MSRNTRFTAKFLAVAMFFLFLPRVSRSDTYVDHDCDAGYVLSRMSDPSMPSPSEVASDEDHRFGRGTDKDSVMYTGGVERVGFTSGLAGSFSNLDHRFGTDKDSVLDRGGFERVGASADPVGSSGPNGSGDHLVPVTSDPIALSSPFEGAATSPGSSAPIGIPEPEWISLVVLGFGFLLLRRVLNLLT